MNEIKTYTPTGPATQPPPKSEQQLADELAQKTTGTEVFQDQLLKPNVLSK